MADEKKAEKEVKKEDCPCLYCKEDEEYGLVDKPREERVWGKGVKGRFITNGKEPKMPKKFTAFYESIKSRNLATEHARVMCGAAGLKSPTAEVLKKYETLLHEYINSENFTPDHFEVMKKRFAEFIQKDGGAKSVVAARVPMEAKALVLNQLLEKELAVWVKNGGALAAATVNKGKASDMGDTNVVEMLKGDAGDASWRVGAEKMVDMLKAPLVGAIVGTQKIENAQAKAAIAGFFDSDLGSGFIALLAGAAVTALPISDEGGKKDRIAKELRVLGMQKGLKKGVDLVTKPLEEMLKNMAAGGDFDAKMNEFFETQMQALPPAQPQETKVEVVTKEKVAVPVEPKKVEVVASKSA